MLKFITIISLLACMATVGMAQNRANIKGKVVDSISKEAMEFATVAVVNQRDSSLVSYTTTLKTGEFALHNLPSGVALKVVISFVGYDNYRKTFTLDKGALLDIGTVKMNSKSNILKEVKVQGDAIPIIVKKDTIEFSAEAFKTPPNAVVEELLKRLPGIEVDFNGNISVNGKRVKKLLIDGKQFFSNDPRIASKTLDANMIDKIQVYDDRDDDPNHLVSNAKVDKIINLKLKNAIKRSTTGKVHGGYGTRDRFDAGLLYSTFRDTLQVSAIIIGNNLNRTGFSQGDLNGLGGFNRGGNEALRYGGLATGGRNGSAIESIGSGGLNINTDYGKKLKINLLYYYSYTSDVYNSSYIREQFFGDTTLSSNGISLYNTTSNKHNISSLVEWNPDTLVKIRYQPQVSFNNDHSISDGGNSSFNNFTPRLNASINTSDNHNNSFQFQQTFSYYRRLHKKGESLNISHSLNTNNGTGLGYSLNNLTSYTTALASSNLNRLADNGNNNTDASLNINYRYPFSKKITGDISIGGSFNHNNGSLFTYDFSPKTTQYTVYIDSLSRNLVRNQFNETIRPEISYQINKETVLNVNVGIQFTQLYNRFNKNVPDINRYETYLLPGLDFYTNKFSFSYYEYVYQPSIDNLVPYTTVYSQLYSSTGNPNLKAARTHSTNAYYYLTKSESQVSGYINAGFSFDENSNFNETNVSSQGATYSKPANKNGAYSYNFGVNYSKGFKKFHNWQIRSSTNISDRFRHEFYQVNNKEGFQNTTNITLGQNFFINYNNKFEVNPSYSISPSITTYQNLTYNSVNYARQTLTVPTVIKGIKHYIIEGTYTYNYNPLVSSGFRNSSNILNLSVARLFQYRDRAEIRLSCYDLFDQNINNFRYVSGNTVTEQQSQILKRYFLLTYTWRFLSTVTKK